MTVSSSSSISLRNVCEFLERERIMVNWVGETGNGNQRTDLLNRMAY